MKILTNNPLTLSPNPEEEYLETAIRSNAGCKAYVEGKIIDLSLNSRGDLVVKEHKPEVFLTHAEFERIKTKYAKT